MKQPSFEKFYFDKVATGEGCGCAERIIDAHEFNRLAGRSRRLRPFRFRFSWRGFLNAAGLTRRPSAPDQ